MCDNFPSTDKIYILDNKPGSVVHACDKVTDDRYLCKGPINGGVWKLERNANGCKWLKCSKPFSDNDKDYSDCVITNFPYYLSWNGTDKCSVNNLFTGKTTKEDCGGDKVCCTEGSVCNRTECSQFKALDKYLISDNLEYKCVDSQCTKTESGKGDFTNPFCDYQCSSVYYPKDYACINGYCQKVANKGSFPDNTNYYDNPYCDSFCPTQNDISFNCVDDSCIIVNNKSGQYPDILTCTKNCGKNSTPSVSDSYTGISPYKLLAITIINVILIYAIIIIIKKIINK